jgi:hypothetical protein
MPAINGQSQALYLDLDYKANNPENFIENELHVVDTTTDSFIRPLYGRFYKESVTVSYVEADGNVIPLVKDIDFDYCDIDRASCLKSGMAVFETILVHAKPNITNKFYISYRAVGGQKDANKSLAQKNSLNTALGSNKPVYYVDVIAKPQTVLPIQHKHDAKDYSGFEYINAAISEIGTLFAISKNTYLSGDIVPYPSREVNVKVSGLTTTLTNSMNSLTNYINAHLNSSGYPHNYTKQSIGLGNLTDGGFSSITVDGLALPIYASPATVATALLPANRPSKTTYPHASLSGNVHGDTPSSIGLGNVSNLQTLDLYIPGTYQYRLELSSDSQNKYVTNTYLYSALAEYQADSTATNLTGRLAALNSNGGIIATLSNTINASSQTIQMGLAASNAVLDSQVSLNNALTAFQKENNRFQLIESNAPLVKTLQNLMKLERGNDLKGYGVYGGVYPIPPSIENLYLWLEADSNRNTIVKDIDGHDRITAMVDRSPYARVFANANIAACPKLTDSRDKTDGVIGLLYKKIALFETGYSLKQISGDPVRMSSGMTFFFLYRNNLNVNFRLISSVNGRYGVRHLGLRKNLLAISDDNWVCAESNENSSPFFTSQLNILSISDVVESNSWFAGSTPVPLNTGIRGLKPNTTTWPPIGQLGEIADYIGTTFDPIPQSFELSSIIAYNRQLSLAECKVVVNYLSMSKSNNQAYAMDYASTNAF